MNERDARRIVNALSGKREFTFVSLLGYLSLVMIILGVFFTNLNFGVKLIVNGIIILLFALVLIER